ncbi:hypothetical protein C2869_02080 [Saccharobesus litoralis]|uniref:Uncharacterized protein n=1 Tax=Saccharobesus litoralis TaxID=2172099 RepID=A0A2S0VM58_9ALTE|nr:hypothetical protein C2869_02080 [Saccharobesus litoralis]
MAPAVLIYVYLGNYDKHGASAKKFLIDSTIPNVVASILMSIELRSYIDMTILMHSVSLVIFLGGLTAICYLMYCTAFLLHK